MAKVVIDLMSMTARVEPRVNEKYARKLVQDKLKSETDYKGGWTCWIDNLYTDDNYYDFSLTNPFYQASRGIELAHQAMQQDSKDYIVSFVTSFGNTTINVLMSPAELGFMRDIQAHLKKHNAETQITIR